MTYSIFADDGNLIAWFYDRALAFDYLERFGRANPEIADDVFMMMDKGDPEWPDGFVSASEALAAV